MEERTGDRIKRREQNIPLSSKKENYCRHFAWNVTDNWFSGEMSFGAGEFNFSIWSVCVFLLFFRSLTEIVGGRML